METRGAPSFARTVDRGPGGRVSAVSVASGEPGGGALSSRAALWGVVLRGIVAPAVAAGLAVLLALALPAPAAAQPGPLESPITVEFTALGGVLSPAGNLTGDIPSAPPPFPGDPANAMEVSDSPAFGGGVGVRLLGTLAVEGQLLFAPGAELQTVDRGIEVTGAEVLTATGYLLYQFPLPVVEPFVGAGGGVKRLSFDDPTVLGTDDESDLTGTVLAGAYVDLIPGWTIRVDARDYISSFSDPRVADGDSELQNDLVFTAGLAWRIP